MTGCDSSSTSICKRFQVHSPEGRLANCQLSSSSLSIFIFICKWSLFWLFYVQVASANLSVDNSIQFDLFIKHKITTSTCLKVPDGEDPVLSLVPQCSRAHIYRTCRRSLVWSPVEPECCGSQNMPSIFMLRRPWASCRAPRNPSKREVLCVLIGFFKCCPLNDNDLISSTSFLFITGDITRGS